MLSGLDDVAVERQSTRFRSSGGNCLLHSVFGTTPKNVPPSQWYTPALTRVTRKSPTETRDIGGKLSAHEFAAALENIGSFIGKLAAAVEQLFSAVHHIFTRIYQDFSALLGLLGDQAARILTALRGVEQAR